MKATVSSKKTQAPAVDARLIIAPPSQNADFVWATGFWAPDPAAFLEVRGRRFLVVRDLEVDRARKNPRLDGVFASSDLAREVRRKGNGSANGGHPVTWVEMVDLLCRKHRVKKLLVPADFGAVFADELRSLRYKVFFKDAPFYEKRVFKTAQEVKYVSDVMRVTERAMGKAIALIHKSKVRKGKLYYHGEGLTSDSVRRMIHLELMAGGCVADLNSIVACGEDSADPHEIGKGPLRANLPIIIDLFPRSLATGYYGDISRTVVKGKPTEKLKAMYRAVKQAVDLSVSMYRPNQKVAEIFQLVHRLFQDHGFKTGEIRGKRQGFIHSVGHGLGLNIHEEPGIGSGPQILRPGHLVTVEPGLYYRGTGGVRIEDLYWITAKGARRITRLPNVFEV